MWLIPLLDKRGWQVWSLVNTCHTWAFQRWVIIKRYTNLRLLHSHLTQSPTSLRPTTDRAPRGIALTRSLSLLSR